jgi:hypothetical protein
MPALGGGERSDAVVEHLLGERGDVVLGREIVGQ